MDNYTDRLSWIKDLVRAEEQMEESGVIDLNAGLDPSRYLFAETLRFLNQLKNEFVEAANAFNQLKTSAVGRVKIYGIAKTQADFMLFRNGFKMIFSLKEPGQIAIRFNFIGPTTAPSAITNSMTSMLMDEHLITAKQGPFGDVTWTYDDASVAIAALVRYHMSLFIRESAK